MLILEAGSGGSELIDLGLPLLRAICHSRDVCAVEVHCGRDPDGPEAALGRGRAA